MSDQIGVYKAIAAVMTDIGKSGISKDRKNQQQGYSFRGIDDVYNELNSLLSKNNLLMLPKVLNREQVERQTKSGSPLFFTTVTVEYSLVCALDGSKATIITVGEAMDSADKSSNKALSAAYKYAAMQLFCIPTEGDNDADNITHVIVPKASKAPSREPYEKIEKGIHQIEQSGNLEDLTAWYKTHVKTIEGFPDDWNSSIMGLFSETKDNLKAKAAA